MSDTARSLHPDDAELVAWSQGDLDAEASEVVESHLESCDACAARLEEIELAPDPFLLKLRGAAGTPDPVSASDQDHNLLFGTLALQSGLITTQQFADACVLWTARTGATLEELLVERGWIDEEDRATIGRLVAKRSTTGPKRSAAETLSGRDHPARSPGDTLSVSPRPDERIRLRQLHSTGGIGQVWRADDELLGREVALKELLPELRGSKAHRERFFREARVAAQLAHPGSAPVYEYREEGGRCYYTMKFYSGRTYSEVIRDAHSASESSETDSFDRLFPLLEQFLSICDTIAYAHAHGIVHRDLKGENVVLGEYGEVTVIDWGLAKSIAGGDGAISPARSGDSDSHTLDGERLGTPGFMAPEQARGDLAAIDERTDVYGLAAVLYEVLTTRAPFSGETANEVMHRVEVAPPKAPRVSHPDTPPALEAICLKGLEKDKAKRYRSAADLRDAVRGWLADQLHQRRESDRQAKFFALSHDLFVALDDRGQIKQVNPAYAAFFGFDPERSAGKPYTEGIHPDDVETAQQMFGRLRRGVSQRDTMIRIKDVKGHYRPVSWTVTRIPGEATMYAVGRPLDPESEHRREVDARARFFSLTPDLFVVSDERGAAAQVNRAWTTELGWEPDDVVGKRFWDFVHPEDVAPLTRSARRALVREAVANLEVRMRLREGGYRTFAWTLCRVPGQRVNYAIGRDVTEKKRAEERLRAILDTGPEALLVVDKSGRIEFANRVLCRLFGYMPDEVEGASIETLMPEPHRERHRSVFADYMKQPTVRSMGRGAAFPAARKDGSTFLTQISLSPLLLSDGGLSILAAVQPEFGLDGGVPPEDSA